MFRKTIKVPGNHDQKLLSKDIEYKSFKSNSKINNFNYTLPLYRNRRINQLFSVKKKN